MTARTFGKKVIDGGEPVISRREAFLAAERARAERVAEADLFSPAGSALRASLAAEQASNDGGESASEPGVEVEESTAPDHLVPLNRSLPTAYALWLILGLVGGHRFYLARPFTGAIQATLFIASLGAVVAYQYYPAFGGLLLSWLWFFIDGLQIKKMHAGGAGQ